MFHPEAIPYRAVEVPITATTATVTNPFGPQPRKPLSVKEKLKRKRTRRAQRKARKSK
jgi:hypothetical protein